MRMIGRRLVGNKNVLNGKVQDVSAALPKNCQTTIRIVKPPLRTVNVTSVIAHFHS
jgi:hypothetical protein